MATLIRRTKENTPFNYSEISKTGVKYNLLYRKCVLFLSARMVRNIVRSDKHVTSYARHTRRSACRSSCKVVVTILPSN
jgi:hypothetical protein